MSVDENLTQDTHVKRSKINAASKFKVFQKKKKLPNNQWWVSARSLLDEFTLYSTNYSEHSFVRFQTTVQFYTIFLPLSFIHRTLDSIHNLGTKLDTGDFHSSPTISTLCEADQFPLWLGRLKLSFSCVTKLNQQFLNIAFKALFPDSPLTLDKPRDLKLFLNTYKNTLQIYVLNAQNQIELYTNRTLNNVYNSVLKQVTT